MSGKIITFNDGPINFTEHGQASLIKSDFDNFVWDKGYNVYHDKMMDCPCKTKRDAPLSTCRNCRGTGLCLVEREQTKMVLQGMNLDTKFKSWTEENIGLVRITALNTANLCYNDRIISLDGETIYNEILYIESLDISPNSQILFSWLMYEMVKPLKVYLFVDSDTKLTELFEGEDYTYEDDRFFLNLDKYDINLAYRVSIRYICRPQFHIVELTRDIINTWTQEDNVNRIANVSYPIAAVGRRSHLRLDKQNYNKDLLLNNT